MKPGDKVICVDDKFPDWVIRANVGGVTHDRGRRPSQVILLIGLNNPISEASGQEFGFQPKRFRLLEELKAEAAARVEQKTFQRNEIEV